MTYQEASVHIPKGVYDTSKGEVGTSVEVDSTSGSVCGIYSSQKSKTPLQGEPCYPFECPEVLEKPI